MRTMTKVLAAGAMALGLAATAGAQVTVTIANTACAAPINASTVNGELYTVKLKPGAATDWMWDTTQSLTPGSNPRGASVGGITVNTGVNWRDPFAPTDVVFVYVTYPTGGIAIASGVVDSNGAFPFGVVPQQRTGDSLPSTYVGLNGRDFVLSNCSPAGCSINMGAVTRTFPSIGTFAGGMWPNIVFAPLADVRGIVHGACDRPSIPAAFAPGTSRGAIIGYNVYRVTGTSGSPPATAAFMGNWQYFMPFNFALDVADNTGAAAPPVPALSDPSPGAAKDTLVGFQNVSGNVYSGDELLIFEDSATTPNGAARVSGSAPLMDSSVAYWYAFQPVALGSVSQLNGMSMGSPTLVAAAVNTPDGANTGIRLDPAASRIDFYSPQAASGQAGLGLTWNSMPLLSAPVFLDPATAPLPAFGDVNFDGRADGGDVNITFTTALEEGNVLGFNVYRVAGTTRSRVNDQLIPARGGEGNVYALVDAADATSRRVRRAVATYEIEVVFSDGSPSTLLGPFEVSFDRSADPGQRRR